MKELIITPAPISIENLKKYFASKDITYIIDYESSQLKGKKLLTYLSNLDIPSDIKIDAESDEFRDLLLEYMKSHFLINSETLEIYVIKMLFQAKGMAEEDPYMKKFIDENKEVVDKWLNIINSLFAYNMYTLNSQDFKEYARSFPHDDSIDCINFVNLFKYSDFYNLFSNIDEKEFKFYNKFFDEYIFKGKSLFDYWTNEKNHIFLMTWGISENIIEAEDIIKVVKNDSKYLIDNKISF